MAAWPISPGVYPMLYAFFDQSGELRMDAFKRQIDVAVATGCAGVAVLGLATEVSKLSEQEREATLRAVADHLGGAAALMVTVFGETPATQVSFAQMATEAGADWLTLQPPPTAMDDTTLTAFFSEIAAAVDAPLGVQNAAEFIGYGLSSASIQTLAARHDNFVATKLECPAVDLAEVADALGADVSLFNGRCGLELPDNLRAGAAGVVPSIETADLHMGIWNAFQAGDLERADALYAEAAPIIASLMQGVPHLVAYGKLLAAERLGLEPCSGRAPVKPMTAFGRGVVARQAAGLGRLV